MSGPILIFSNVHALVAPIMFHGRLGRHHNRGCQHPLWCMSRVKMLHVSLCFTVQVESCGITLQGEPCCAAYHEEVKISGEKATRGLEVQ